MNELVEGILINLEDENIEFWWIPCFEEYAFEDAITHDQAMNFMVTVTKERKKLSLKKGKEVRNG